MRITTIRYAQFLSRRSAELEEASRQLHPPIPLFRRILRAHTKLPREMRIIGDDYVKAEFRRHRETSNPLHIIGFLKEWKIYLDTINSVNDPTQFRGKKLDTGLFDKMSDDQIEQLYEVMHATKEIWNTTDGVPAGPHSTRES